MMSLEPDILSKALVKVGANKWMRKKYYECSMVRCLGDVFLNLNEDGGYKAPFTITQRFGSFIEGTTTIGMGSDIDEIDVETNDVIEEGFEGTRVKNVNRVVAVTDMFTPPGFVKMKVDGRGRYIDFKLEKDIHGNCFLSNIYTDDYKQHTAKLLQTGQDPSELEKHGPALTNFNEPGNQIESIDAIKAFHCKTGLSFNQEFFNRKRCYGWPTQSDLDKMKGQGCLLVPTGHSRCERKHRILHWRISFSFQERHIMLNLNDAQYKCYILLKLVKKSHISPVVGLTSYHCKTVLFHTIENTPRDYWRPGNLLNCFILCLKRLKKWSRNRTCPNYFLPDLNLFTGKIDTREIPKLIRILTSIIQSPVDSLQRVQTDGFGKLVHLNATKTANDENVEEEVDTNVAKKLHKLLVDITNSVFNIKNIVLQKISYKCNDLDEIIHRHIKWLDTINSLQENNEVGPYQLDNLTWVLPHVCKFLHTSLASHLAIKASETIELAMEKDATSTETEEMAVETDKRTIKTEEIATEMEDMTGETEEMVVETDKRTIKTEEIATEIKDMTGETEEMVVETDKRTIKTEEIATEADKRDLDREQTATKALEIAMGPEKTSMICWLTLNTAYHYWMGLNSDAMSGKMKLAAFLRYTGQLDMETFKSNYCPAVNTQSLCDCTTSTRGNLIQENEYKPFIKMFQLSPLETLKMSTSEYISKYVSTCIIFLPTESKITFYPLQFEMFRSYGSSITLFDEYQQIEFKKSNREFDNCATLDSKVYGILMTVLLSDNSEDRKRNIRMLQISSSYDTLAHRETTFNLSGWLASAEKIDEKSLYFYKRSWVYYIKQQQFKLQAEAVYDKNAAKWHLALLLFRAWMEREHGKQ